MKHELNLGDYVIWRWSSGYGHGKIISISTELTEIESKGETIVREGSPVDPAITIIDHNDVTILKLASELEKAM